MAPVEEDDSKNLDMTSCFGASWGRPFFLIHRDTPSDLQKQRKKSRNAQINFLLS